MMRLAETIFPAWFFLFRSLSSQSARVGGDGIILEGVWKKKKKKNKGEGGKWFPNQTVDPKHQPDLRKGSR